MECRNSIGTLDCRDSKACFHVQLVVTSGQRSNHINLNHLNQPADQPPSNQSSRQVTHLLIDCSSYAEDCRRYLKDVNNNFHKGASITFHELVTGVQQVDDATWLSVAQTTFEFTP